MNFYANQMDIEYPHPDIIIIPDTNIFIHHLPFISSLLSVLPLPNFNFIIPFTVINELDGLKSRRLSDDVKYNARKSIDFIYGLFLKRLNWARGQSAEEVVSVEKLSGDDAILECCRYFVKSSTVILITNDKNLSNKALIYNVTSLQCPTDHIEFLSELISQFNIQLSPHSQVIAPREEIIALIRKGSQTIGGNVSSNNSVPLVDPPPVVVNEQMELDSNVMMLADTMLPSEKMRAETSHDPSMLSIINNVTKLTPPFETLVRLIHQKPLHFVSPNMLQLLKILEPKAMLYPDITCKITQCLLILKNLIRMKDLGLGSITLGDAMEFWNCIQAIVLWMCEIANKKGVSNGETEELINAIRITVGNAREDLSKLK
ncbi:hypothetical protein HK098_000089 [Nowakowskiella sp. JEL0407]|nr:hypothetical protein HK098_000089 [Nowakowskiella sp. JEL0407]